MKKVLYILGELNDEDLEWLIRVGEKKNMAPQEVLIQEGKAIDALYIVVEGAFSIQIQAAGNKEVARVGAGEVLGEMSYVDSRPPSATVVAAEKSLVLAIPRDLLSEKLKEDMGFAAHFYRALSIFMADRLRTTTSQLGYGEVDEEARAEGALEEDELDLDQLDSASMGGARFDQIIKRLKGV
jgi:CRP/FNR family transcriptional regulator, cyclic AMP receptor protein